ncbi:GRP family sugar transporter [Paenibacillus agilis]|uniref:EamA family transporter n=1 Tax=Paenibacillus agilis TaxID=3020863 RepID=A0A559IVY7_9BACL|nr:GRP family sugar transporter [Paenibacillus agilis]TVX91751.1 EamA family transporter [Paenibacillus agilis]
MDILLALVPALFWGTLLLVSSKLGGKAHHQLVGMTFGALLFAIGIYLFKQPELSTTIWTAGIISGVCWALGQYNQFSAVQYLGVSRTVPISTGMQLVVTTLFGVIVFGEWSTTTSVILGIIAIVLLIIGVVFTVMEDKQANNQGTQMSGGSHMQKGIVHLVISTVGFVGYVIILRWFEVDGWAAILPQAIGMVLGGLLLTLKHKPFNKYTFRNILTGAWWGAGNLALLLSIPLIGVATSFSLSQTGTIISTLGGIFLLNERKSKRQMVFVIIGCLLIVVGGVMIGFTKE